MTAVKQQGFFEIEREPHHTLFYTNVKSTLFPSV